MKTKVLVLAVVGAFLFSVACKKVDQQLLTDIGTFETDWTKFANDAAAWGETLKSECGKIMAAHQSDEMKKMMGWAKTLKGASKMKCDSLMGVCKATEDACTSMQGSFSTSKADWDKVGTDFADWKAKVEKGEIDNETAKSDLAGYQQKLTDGKSNLSSWGDKWNQQAAAHKGAEEGVAGMMPKK